MADRGAQVTPIRGKPTPENADKPTVQPKRNEVNKPLVLAFSGAIAAALAVFVYSQFSAPPADHSMVERERGGRITGTNNRMRTGLNLGEGRMTATLQDDTGAPARTGPATLVAPGDKALKARITDLEAALLEAGKASPEIGKLVADAAYNAGRIAELEIALEAEQKARSDDKAAFDTRSTQIAADLTLSHTNAIGELNAAHQEELALARGDLITAQEEAATRIAALMDERAAASRNARIRSKSVIVNRRIGTDSEQPYGAPVIPSNPATSLAKGTTFGARLLADVNVAVPGSVTALVGSDIRSASGSNILIPRGSTLRGRYTAETRAGETRIIVSWADLIFPDGPTKRLAAGMRGDNALASTLWPNDPASLNRESQVTVLVMNEVAIQD